MPDFLQKYAKKFCIIMMSAAFAAAFSGCGESGNVVYTHIEPEYTGGIAEDGTDAGDSVDITSQTDILGSEDKGQLPAKNLWSALSVPTQITKIGDKYFIVDCYNDQVIYSDSIDVPLNEWYVMTKDISKGHTVASDGTVYLVDDTENHRVLVFEYSGDVFVNTQVI